MQDDPLSKPIYIPNHVNVEDLIRQLVREIAQRDQEIAQRDQEIEKLTNTVAVLQELVQQLRDEVAVLKGLKPKPKISPSKLENDDDQSKGDISGSTSKSGQTSNPQKKSKKGQPKGKQRKKKKTLLTIHEERVIQPSNIPAGAVFKGYKPYTVQDIIFEAHTTKYLLARWQLPDGTYVNGKIPENVYGHYGPELVSYILHQVHACRVTENLLLKQLHERGILISAGQLDSLLINAATSFQQEVNELMPAGVAVCNELQADDTGGRHKGHNQFTTVIGNKWFSFFATTESKSRVNFLKLLQGGADNFLINEDTIAYLKGVNAPHFLLGYMGLSLGAKFSTLQAWEAFLQERNITNNREVRLITEAALCASVIASGMPRDLGIHSDDAGQFDVVLFVLSLCWIHEERHYRKLIMTTDQGKADLERVMDQIWGIYRELKSYKLNPSESEKIAIKKLFEETFTQKTSSSLLNDRLEKTYRKKEALLKVLERPATPLHNNMSETDARAAKIKLKVSGGTRSDAGKQARDVFLSLKQTCRKLGISFLEFLKDRVHKLGKIPSLAKCIWQRTFSEIATAPPDLSGRVISIA